jgi:hypothetical protein
VQDGDACNLWLGTLFPLLGERRTPWVCWLGRLIILFFTTNGRLMYKVCLFFLHTKAIRSYERTRLVHGRLGTKRRRLLDKRKRLEQVTNTDKRMAEEPSVLRPHAAACGRPDGGEKRVCEETTSTPWRAPHPKFRAPHTPGTHAMAGSAITLKKD